MARIPKKMRLSYCIWALIASVAIPATLCADGQYRICKDSNGIYFQTENDGGWYIPEEDLIYFELGQSGHYRIARDGNGRYLETEQGKFYLGYRDREAYEQEIETVHRPQKASKTSDFETEVLVVGQHVIVPVRIKYRGRSIDLHLLLDTGASVITLHKGAVNRLRLPKKKTVYFTTADGHMITADMVELEEVRFGPYCQNGLMAGIIEYKRGGADYYDGLLGMNALKGLDYKIDYERRVIRWMTE